MKFIRNLFKRSQSTEPKSLQEADFLDYVYGGSSHSGIQPTPSNGMNYATVYACVRVISESIAQMELNLYQRTEQGKQIAHEHPGHKIFNESPNAQMTPAVFKEVVQSHALTWGGGFAAIGRLGNGSAYELYPLLPNVTQPTIENSELVFYTQVGIDNPRTIRLPADEVLYIPALGFDGLRGYSPISKLAESIGLGWAATRFGSKFFGDGAKLSGVLEHPTTLRNEDVLNRLKKQFQDNYGGLDSSHKTAILEEGMKYHAIGIPPEDAQFLETRKFQRSEIAGAFRVPPHKIGDLERATFSNIEHQSREFVNDTLMPWLIKWEQELNRKLLTQADRNAGYFFKFNVNALLRGDSESRANFYRTMFDLGAYTPNKILELEDENTFDGGDEHYLLANNYMPINQIGQLEQPDEVERMLPFIRAASTAIAQRQSPNTESETKKYLHFVSLRLDPISEAYQCGQYTHQLASELKQNLPITDDPELIHRYIIDTLRGFKNED